MFCKNDKRIFVVWKEIWTGQQSLQSGHAVNLIFILIYQHYMAKTSSTPEILLGKKVLKRRTYLRNFTGEHTQACNYTLKYGLCDKYIFSEIFKRIFFIKHYGANASNQIIQGNFWHKDTYLRDYIHLIAISYFCKFIRKSPGS